ncbi:YbgA family protein [Rhodothermus marinus]|uniref:YbgA family protein n=1 Tax=Rhodothermus marinus TaxID=29549 RepID=UPI0037C653BD
MTETPHRLRVGISSCLLGEPVRFNGGHARDRSLIQLLGPFVEWVPMCPEVAVGMGVPREAVRLVGDIERPRLVGSNSGRDWTDAMRTWSEAQAEQIAQMDLDGFILKSRSPTCGLFRVKVYDQNGVPRNEGRGLFADALARRLPLLPMEEEGRLRDPLLRENFVDRLFAYHRLRQLLRSRPKPADLIRFHTAHKLTLLSHSPAYLKQLGQLVAHAGSDAFPEILDRYARLFMEAMNRPATRKKHTNVLQHLAGYLHDHLSAEDRAELRSLIDDYRKGMVPLIAPLILLRHHIRRTPVHPWVKVQVYLEPYPKELMLRNF